MGPDREDNPQTARATPSPKAAPASTIHPVRDGVVSGLVVFLVASLSLVTVYLRSTDAVRTQVRRNLVALAQVAASTVDGDLHQTLRSAEQENSAAYRQAVESLRRLRERAPEIKFVYTVTLVHDQCYFVLDPTPPGDADGDGVDDHSYLMQPYPDADPQMLEVLRHGGSLATSQPYHDLWGTFVSGYAPILDRAGQQVGAVGVDLSVDRYDRELAAVRWIALGGLGLALGVSCAIGILVYLARQGACYSEELYRHLFASSADGLWLLDREGTIVEVSPSACQIYGYARQELLGSPGRNLVPIPEQNHFAYCLTLIRQGQVVVEESTHLHKDGTLFPVEITGSGFWLRGELRLLLVVRDMTERRQQERDLRESQRRLDLALGGAALSLWDWHIPSGTHYVSERWAAMLGYTPDEIPGTLDTWMMLMHPEDRQPTWQLVQSHFDTAAPYAAEFRMRAKSGEWLWIQSRGMVVERDESRLPLRMIGIHQDVSSQKAAQTQLALAKEAAEAANRAKSQFLANMSHEIRTPMTAILGYLELIVQNCPRTCSNGQNDVPAYSAIVLQNAHLLLQIINDILDLSKIEAGKFEIERVVCAPHQILSDVVELLKVRAESKGLGLSLDYQGPIPEAIQTDPVRLRQVLINLVGNALKFTEVGEVRIRTRLRGYPGDLPQLEIQVQDTGIGMSPEQVERLFRPFSQVDTSASRRFGGTGLGLMLSRRLAELLGGDVTVQSARGQGSSFTFTLAVGPLVGATFVEGGRLATLPPAAAVRPVALDDVPLACRVLLVEDGPDNQRLLAFLLRKAGAEVVVASNGQAGIAEALASRQTGRPFEVILMDMQMPILDGYQATRRLRQQGWTGAILALTAHAMKEDRQGCLDAGCDEYLTKPIDRRLLLETVARHAASALSVGSGPQANP